MIGHCERRHLIGESDDMVNRKVMAAIGGGADADRLRRRDARGARAERDAAVLDRQMEAGLDASPRRSPTCHRLRAGVGHRHRAERDAAQAEEAHAHIRTSSGRVRRRCGRARAT